MIHHICGKVVERTPTYIVLETAGIGYQVHVSLHTYEAVGNQDEVKLLIYPVIREDAHLLFGFSSDNERELFRLLISVSGIGANTARLIQSSLSPDELIGVIASEDVATLKKVKGIGAKSASRVILELKDKVALGAGDNLQILTNAGNTFISEALSGLLVLGFDKKKATAVVEKLHHDRPDARLEEVIKESIRLLS